MSELKTQGKGIKESGVEQARQQIQQYIDNIDQVLDNYKAQAVNDESAFMGNFAEAIVEYQKKIADEVKTCEYYISQFSDIISNKLLEYQAQDITDSIRINNIDIEHVEVK